MKKLIFAMLVVGAFASCGKDDCTAEGFVGTWTGTEKCTGESDAQVTISITGSGDRLVIDGGTFIEEAVSRDDCSLEGGTSVLGTGNKISGSLSADGKSLTISNNSTLAGVSVFSCTYQLTK
ncbi:MAG: hypothetical protein IPN86_16070 [Saprospiraceae bacterium]|nr:hypothetical protein [Saprospiraceae bacterium]